jgi:predicted cupin superfamily sugar epimerase
MLTPQQLIQRFDLQPHPEGGWYKEQYRSTELIDGNSLPPRYQGDRCFSTSIYFLLERGEFSGFHKIQSDECWHFYAGDPMEIYVIEKGGSLTVTVLGNNVEANQIFHYVVPAGLWFASRPAPGSAFSFVGCTVAPGFEFADFELADADKLSAIYPQHATLIRSMCI